MASGTETGTYGFRFTAPSHLALCDLFAVGRDVIRHPSYRWDGHERKDGPLLLFQYTLEGEGMFESGTETYRIDQGRAIMTEIPGNHRYYFPADGSHWSFVFILMRPSLILPNWEEAKLRLGEAPYLPPTSRPVRALQEIWDQAGHGRITDPYTASSCVYSFISELCRYAVAPHDERRNWPEKVRLAAEYMDVNYRSMISLDQLSDRLGWSKYHLLRTFAAAVGQTPSEYLNRVRIEQAMRLLRQTDMSVEQIAEQVGYSGGSYLIKVFRKMTGLTPGGFRSEEGQLTFSRMFFEDYNVDRRFSD
ncbi:AraC-like DNA-binding protein [Paenibacillus rhizosphaerae]|uniref:AraC-like DNA-binding protein n=1 Tax=Paenibacillus rhizosphaerae TaxID=297318 RepID=A0A839TPX0_9BACL|nr:AraC family transcriptional regulator [Paenibacillus rhizosphaerae]MBB3128815.1 AraC-like DNA-binding protein [Paenibacillus rhizosphaerae]